MDVAATTLTIIFAPIIQQVCRLPKLFQKDKSMRDRFDDTAPSVIVSILILFLIIGLLAIGCEKFASGQSAPNSLRLVAETRSIGRGPGGVCAYHDDNKQAT